MNISEQSDKVATYFDDISQNYRDRYSAQNPFHNYFFRERLSAATDGQFFDNKVVLDVGAGTGPLYDQLIKHDGMDYYACDVSPKMLSQSSIPPNRTFVGKVSDIHFPRDEFDYIFLLGVTTYQKPAELEDTLQFIRDHLAPGGAAILSFTNRSSIDRVLRSVLRLARPFISKGVIGQSFKTYTYRTDDIVSMVREYGLRPIRTVYLNQAFSPFNTLLPRPSIALAKWLSRNSPNFMLPFCSADFLLFLEHATSSEA